MSDRMMWDSVCVGSGGSGARHRPAGILAASQHQSSGRLARPRASEAAASVLSAR